VIIVMMIDKHKTLRAAGDEVPIIGTFVRDECASTLSSQAADWVPSDSRHSCFGSET